MKNKSSGFIQIIIPIILALVILAGIGYFAIKNSQKNKDSSNSPLNSPTPMANQAPTSDPTNWKTYKNKDYSFEFRYPEGWIILNKNTYPKSAIDLDTLVDSGNVTGPTEPYTKINYHLSVRILNNISTPLEQYISGTNAGVPITLNKSNINNYEIYKSSNVPSMFGEYHVYFKRDEKNYIELILGPYSEKEPGQNQNKIINTFDQILSTFNFIDEDQDPTIITYKGLGVTFRYPSSISPSKPINNIIKTSPGGSYQQSFGSDQGIGLILSVNPRPKNKNKKFQTLDEQYKSITNKVHINVVGQDAIKVENSNDLPREYNIFFATPTKDTQSIITLNLYVQPAGQSSVNRGKQVFNQILSTFRLLE
jgi:hypothetical protein